jgi:hypothetical protein
MGKMTIANFSQSMVLLNFGSKGFDSEGKFIALPYKYEAVHLLKLCR